MQGCVACPSIPFSTRKKLAHTPSRNVLISSCSSSTHSRTTIRGTVICPSHTTRMYAQSLLVSVLLSSIAAAANFDVNVGSNGDNFSPNTIKASVGDTVTFKFTSSPHDVVESTFDAPCTYKNAGIYAPISKSPTTFIVNVTSTDPTWFFCSVPGHCNSGMVGVINAP
jgi:plastocyanin